MFAIPKEVRALSFDIWGTLLRGNPAFSAARIRRVFDLLGYRQFETDLLLEVYRRADAACNDISEKSGVDCGIRERLLLMFDRLGLEAEVPGDTALRQIQHAVGQLRLNPQYMPSCIERDIAATLQRLSASGYTLGLLSNTGMDNEQVMEAVLKRLGLWHFCSTAIFSSQDRRAKPNPGLFHRMAEELGAEPHEVLHIGDNPRADLGATSAGLHAVLYAPQGASQPSISSMKELVTAR